MPYGTGHIWHHIVYDPKFLEGWRIVRRQLRGLETSPAIDANINNHTVRLHRRNHILCHHHRGATVHRPQRPYDDIGLHQSLRHHQLLYNLRPHAAPKHFLGISQPVDIAVH